MRQKPTKTITAAYTVTDADCGCKLICSSATGFEITLQSATGRYNFELEIDNIGAGEVAVGGQAIGQYQHAHIGNDGGAAWTVVLGGGGGTSNFTDLDDVPASYSGQGGKFVAVNSGATALEFADAPANSSGVFDYGLITDATSTTGDYGGLT